MSGTQPIDALIFDFDGVIIDTESAFHRVWTAVFEEFGCRFSRSEWHSLIGTFGVADPYTWLEQRATRALPEREEIRSIVQSRERVEVDLLGPMPGVLDWLDAAHDANVPVGIASSSSRSWVDGRLAQLGILDSFPVVVCRDEHRRAKPAPDVYLAACRELGGDPARSVAIEDSRNGVSSALAAGLMCIAVPNEITAGMDLSGAHHLMNSLKEASLTQVLELIGERRRMLDPPSDSSSAVAARPNGLRIDSSAMRPMPVSSRGCSGPRTSERQAVILARPVSGALGRLMVMATREQITEFFNQSRNAIVGGIRRDGSPHLTPNWFSYDGEHLYVSTTTKRAKYRVFKHDPRVTILVDDAEGRRYVSVRGTVEIREDLENVLPHFRATREKVGVAVPPDEEFLEFLRGDDRVLLVITPDGPIETWTASGFS